MERNSATGKLTSATARTTPETMLALAAVATEVNHLRERVQRLEGSESASQPLPASFQRIMEDIDYQI